MGLWKSKVAYQMHLLSCFCIFSKFTPSWRMAPLAALFLLFSSYRLLGLFTSLTLLFSTLVFMWKHKETAFSFSFSSCTSHVPHRMHETVRHVKESDDDDDDDDDDAPSEVLFLSSSEECDADHTPEFSDGTISDEDSLIEIALPSGHFVNNNNNCCSLQQKKRELSAHDTLMELLAEFNEEENLIEIDIAMGSIKCSRFEIEA
ncbi:uncharacterized protein LOC106779972 [Vigna radiata var. radiata]|uniref:Uncharacterized protein LOC106779972 n=1 Tax=Vigna radiata var. radiata TaxID=3916 RepID=A0A3Q0ELH5_VIGRR|nr:uncharacterized protein LOC106779972 [Vigna radiata var. radiata]